MDALLRLSSRNSPFRQCYHTVDVDDTSFTSAAQLAAFQMWSVYATEITYCFDLIVAMASVTCN